MTPIPVSVPEPRNIRRLQRSILAYLALTLLVLSSAVAVVSLLPLYRSLREKRQETLLSALQSRALTVGEYRDRAQQVAQQIASRTTARNQLEAYNRGELDFVTLQGKSRELLLDALQQSNDVMGITRLDVAGKPVIEIGMTIPPEIWPIPPHQSRQVSMWPLITHIDNRPYIALGAPIVNARGDRVGTDILLFNAEKLQRIVTDFTGSGEIGQVFLGTIWQDTPQILLPIHGEEPTELRLERALTLAGQGSTGLVSDGQRTMTVAYGPVTESPWVLVAIVNSQDLYAPVRQQFLSIGSTTIILILLSTSGMLLVLKPLTGRITLRAEELAEIVRSQTTALREARDDLERRVEERTAQLSQEIRDRKQAEAELKDASDRLTLALRSGDLGYWQWVIASDDLYWDDRLYELHGIPKGELNYDMYRATIHPDDILLFEALVQHALGNQYYENALGRSLPYEVIYRAVHPDGTIHYLKDYGTVLRDGQGEANSMIGICVNITRFKQAEAQLALSNQELKRASQMKDQFLATMSHELRTPLNAILGMTESLQEEIYGAINQQQLNALNVVERSSHHLLSVINDILDLSKIAADKVELLLMPTDLVQLCRSSLQLIQQQAQKKRIQVHTQLPPNLPHFVLDEQRIHQVLINLLSNAVKFTREEGRVTLVVEPQPMPDSTGASTKAFLRIVVSDTGIGIEPENIDKLFQPFVQIDSALNRKYEGTGLGLALVKRIVDLHQGQVSVTSQVRVGSSFTVELPWAVSTPSAIQSAPGAEIEVAAPVATPLVTQQGPQAAKKSPQAGSQEAPFILLVEDDAANRLLLNNYLAAKGYRLTCVENGKAAVDFLQTGCPELILMDIQMPGMDGFEATQQIRQTLGMVDIPIIALTALAMKGDRERCLDAGATDYLSKPVKLKQLVALLQQYLQR